MRLVQSAMAEIVDVRLPSFKSTNVLRPDIEVQVRLPMRGGGKQVRWYHPDQKMPWMKRLLSRFQKDQWDERKIRDMLVGKKIRIPELEAEMQKQGVKLSKKVR